MATIQKLSDLNLAEPVQVVLNGKKRLFDIDDPELPDWVEDEAMRSGGYPYEKKLERKEYEEALELLQIELVKVQYWLQKTGKRVMALFEGRDAAGKGGTIFVIRQYMNPRIARNVALPKPTETERGQWYYQRYVSHFPTAGEFVTFDRSWYNRGVVEPVMGFCSAAQTEKFFAETPDFEKMIVDEGIHFYKLWLNIGQEMQLKRFHDRRHQPLKIWKFSPIDIAGMAKWDDYTRMRDTMLKRTHSKHAPWVILKSNDKRRARLEAIRQILLPLPYDGRDDSVVGKPDTDIVLEPKDIME